jgi:hypothetical protein
MEGTELYLDFLCLNRRSMVPGVQDPIVAPKPFVERVAEVVHSMRDRIGTHMSLRVPSWDSVVRPCG